MPRTHRQLPDTPPDTTFKDARTVGKEFRAQELAESGKTLPYPKPKPLVVTRER